MLWPTEFARVLARGAAAVALLVLVGCAEPTPTAAPMAVAPDHILMLTINFDFDSHRIRPEAYPLLDNVAIALRDQRLAGYHFDLNGHTDIIGRLGYNIALSNLRAQAVADYLAARGVPGDSLHVQGFGPLQLLDSANPANPANRRVEIVSTH